MLANTRVAFAVAVLSFGLNHSICAQQPGMPAPPSGLAPSYGRLPSPRLIPVGPTIDSLLARRRFAAPRTSDLPRSGSTTIANYQSLSGPRVGLIYFSGGITKLDGTDRRKVSSNLMTVFGWQIEDRSFELDNGFAGMTELVGSVAGIDQHLFLPAATVLMAIRTPGGAEFGVGPTVSPTEINITLAGGFTIDAGKARFPINVALVPSRTGPRVSLTSGWVIAR